MLYLALGLSISLTNLCNPFTCMFQLFSWRNANEVILTDTDHAEQVPKTVAEMRELIKELKKEDQKEDPVADALTSIFTRKKVDNDCDHN